MVRKSAVHPRRLSTRPNKSRLSLTVAVPRNPVVKRTMTAPTLRALTSTKLDGGGLRASCGRGEERS